MSSTDKEKIQALEAQLLDLQGQLEAERAGHERYRELTRTNLAEMSWKKDNDTLRAKLESAIKELEWYSNPANFVIHEDTNACEPDHEGDLYPLGARARIVLDKLKRDPFPDTDNSILKARLSAARQAFHDIATSLKLHSDTAIGRQLQMLQEIASDAFEVLEGKAPPPGSLIHDDLHKTEADLARKSSQFNELYARASNLLGALKVAGGPQYGSGEMTELRDLDTFLPDTFLKENIGPSQTYSIRMPTKAEFQASMDEIRKNGLTAQ